MIVNACAKRTAATASLSSSSSSSSSSSISRRCFGSTNSICASNAAFTTIGRNRNRTFARPLRYGRMHTNTNANTNTNARIGSCCLWQQQQRYLSASANTRPTPQRKRKQKKQQQKEQQIQIQQQPIPKWTATASVLIVPFMFAAWGVSDWIFGNRTKGHNEGLRQEFLEEQRRRQVQSDKNDNNNDIDDYWLSSLDVKPTLFHCVIRKNAGLKHCLSGVQLGDVVEVLEEGVGPEKAYNLCRLPAKQPAAAAAAHNVGEDQSQGQQPATAPSLSRDVYGWFPIRWLQKLDHYESIVREQQHNMSSEDPE